MHFQLRANDGRPIYAQIADQVKNAVAAGLLRPGELIPSVRELSRQLVVNPNTVARAYRDLQVEQILEALRGTGLQVAQGAPSLCRNERQSVVRQQLRDVFEEARKASLSREEVERILHEEWERSEAVGAGEAGTNGVEGAR